MAAILLGKRGNFVKETKPPKCCKNQECMKSKCVNVCFCLFQFWPRWLLKSDHLKFPEKSSTNESSRKTIVTLWMHVWLTSSWSHKIMHKMWRIKIKKDFINHNFVKCPIKHNMLWNWSGGFKKIFFLFFIKCVQNNYIMGGTQNVEHF